MQTTNTKSFPTGASRLLADVLAREPLAIPGKLALWSAVAGTFASVGGNIALITLAGGFHLDSFILLGCWVICLGLLVARFRWGPLLTTLLGAYMLTVFFNAPFVMFHLSNPTGPYGGLGAFSGDVALLACNLLLLVGSVAALLVTVSRRFSR